MPELTEEQAEQLHDWQMVLTDVRYALRQLHASASNAARAIDALERIEEAAKRNVGEV